MFIFKKKYFFLLLLFISTDSIAQLTFTRNDSIIMINMNGDTLKNPFAGGFNSVQFSDIDLNIDGFKDLFVFEKADGRITPFINEGIPNKESYIHAPQYIQNFPDLYGWVLLRDYNCDGKMDIFTYVSGGVAVYKNTSTTSLSFELQTKSIKSKYTNLINLYVSSADIPAIDDIDGDGDLDILTFGLFYPNRIEYHKNLSKETYGNCDSLTYELRNNCWGYFSESNSSNSVTLFDTCSFNIGSPERTGKENKHAGSTLLTLDVDGNNSKDLVLGDVSFNNMTLLYNGDNSINLDSSSIIAQDSLFPSNNLSTNPVDINVFPAGFYLDVNNDNKKDLIVTTNCSGGCENNNNVWYYKNNNTTINPDFDLQTTSFLQDGMIEVGEASHPVFFDYNADGLMDIVIGNYGDFKPGTNPTNYKTSLWLYKNIGTNNTPAYQLIDSDYVNISSMNLDIGASQPTLRLIPTFGDIDNDGDEDMIIGDFKGVLHYFENTAGAGNTANFTLNTPQYAGIDIGNYASPQLIDLNKDLLLDLVIGKSNGYISYYQNTGTLTTPSFTLITDSLGYVRTKRFNDFNGYSTPFVFDDNGSYKLMAGSYGGGIYLYDNIDGNLSGTFSIIDSIYLNIWEGSHSFVNLADITNDGNLDLLVGNFTGGVAFYKGSISNTTPKHINQTSPIQIYPNPTSNIININMGNNQLSNASIDVINVLGKIIYNKEVLKQEVTLNLNHYPNGVYFIRFSNHIGSTIYKIVKN
ncbi:MAG: T9SS type A sorting domain-containing protein [Vicingus serpentipes]|nr:T9SS type A sorting domain-containing protein [Vicingus serpentipes]